MKKQTLINNWKAICILMLLITLLFTACSSQMPTPTQTPIPIEKLPVDYTVEMAKNNGDFINKFGQNINENVMNDFIKKVSKKERAFVRTVNITDEGDPVIIDFLYLNDKFIVTLDATRDGYASETSRKIITYERKNLIVTENNGRKFYIVTNLEKITEETYAKNMYEGFILKSDPISK